MVVIVRRIDKFFTSRTWWISWIRGKMMSRNLFLLKRRSRSKVSPSFEGAASSSSSSDVIVVVDDVSVLQADNSLSCLSKYGIV